MSLSSRAFPVALAACLALSGCSLATRGPSSNRPPHVEPDCTRSSALPGIDTAAAIGLGLAGIALLSVFDCDEEGDPLGYGCATKAGAQATLGLGSLVAGAAYAGSAIKGYSSVSRCRDAVSDYESWRVAHAEEARAEQEERESAAPRGRFGGACFENDTCFDVLICDPDTRTCKLPPVAMPAGAPPEIK